jgi:hypothetical protein
VAKHANVVITRNIWVNFRCSSHLKIQFTDSFYLGLVNATTVEDIIWPAGSSQSELPITVWFRVTHKGPTLWHTEPRPNFPTGIPIVPVTPLKTTLELNGKILS